MTIRKSVQHVLWGEPFCRFVEATAQVLHSKPTKEHIEYSLALREATALRERGQLAEARRLLARTRAPQRRFNGHSQVARALKVALIDEAMRSLTESQLQALQQAVVQRLLDDADDLRPRSRAPA